MLLLVWLQDSVRLLTRQQKTVFEASVTQVDASADKFGSLKCAPDAPRYAVLWSKAPLHCVHAEGRATMCATNSATNTKQNDVN